jgi:hypothetical protein
MRKRVDNDATQEVSASMLVPPAKPPVLGNVPKNDASMWMQTQVSAADFVGAKKKPAAGGGRTMVVGAFAVLLLAVTAGGVWYAFLRESPVQTAANPAPPTPAPTPAPAPAVAEAERDAGVPDAAVAEVVDAGTPTVAAMQADAVSAADPAVKKKSTKKRATAKKKVVKKKTATAPKKR